MCMRDDVDCGVRDVLSEECLELNVILVNTGLFSNNRAHFCE
jgi:hypothetical protein